jgi:hypothetical protein
LSLLYPLKIDLRYGNTREYTLLVKQAVLEYITSRCDVGGGGGDDDNNVDYYIILENTVC